MTALALNNGSEFVLSIIIFISRVAGGFGEYQNSPAFHFCITDYISN
jgi:hypothetical protein